MIKHPELPQDSVMLLSVINTKLRDHYNSLSSLCEDLGINQEELIEQLDAIDYIYEDAVNQFI